MDNLETQSFSNNDSPLEVRKNRAVLEDNSVQSKQQRSLDAQRRLRNGCHNAVLPHGYDTESLWFQKIKAGVPPAIELSEALEGISSNPYIMVEYLVQYTARKDYYLNYCQISVERDHLLKESKFSSSCIDLALADIDRMKKELHLLQSILNYVVGNPGHKKPWYASFVTQFSTYKYRSKLLDMIPRMLHPSFLAPPWFINNGQEEDEELEKESLESLQYSQCNYCQSQHRMTAIRKNAVSRIVSTRDKCNRQRAGTSRSHTISYFNSDAANAIDMQK